MFTFIVRTLIYSVQWELDTICFVNVVDAMSLTVDPSGHLERGMTIYVSCEVRYGAPTPLSEEQDPTLELTLDNEQSFPTGQVLYQPAVDTDNFHRKTLVSFYPRDAMLARFFATATCPSVRLSVRLSHAGIVPSRAKAGS